MFAILALDVCIVDCHLYGNQRHMPAFRIQTGMLLAIQTSSSYPALSRVQPSASVAPGALFKIPCPDHAEILHVHMTIKTLEVLKHEEYTDIILAINYHTITPDRWPKVDLSLLFLSSSYHLLCTWTFFVTESRSKPPLTRLCGLDLV